jgi:hypothetical protein
MADNQVLLAMARADGAMISELHLDGLVLKPDEKGVFQVPAQFVVSLMNAGYVWSSMLPNTQTRTPAQNS